MWRLKRGSKDGTESSQACGASARLFARGSRNSRVKETVGEENFWFQVGAPIRGGAGCLPSRHGADLRCKASHFLG